MRKKIIFFSLLALMSLFAARPSMAQSGRWVTSSVSNAFGARNYKLWIPAGYTGSFPVPLVLMLHGCTQNPDDFAAGTQMNAIADANNFLAVYPEQPLEANTNRCWNWFLPEHQARNIGEPSLLAAVVNDVRAAYAVDPTRTYVAGISAGGAMAVLMGAAYPDLFRAIGVSAGLEYKAGTNLAEALLAQEMGGPDPNQRGLAAYQAMGSVSAELRRRGMRVIVFHGSLDLTVNPVNANQIITQWAQTNDQLDDDGDNNTVNDVADVTLSGTVPNGGYNFTTSIYHNGAGRPLLEKWIVQDMRHAWSGGSAAGSYTDPRGPNASAEMWRFFQAGAGLQYYPLPRPLRLLDTRSGAPACSNPAAPLTENVAYTQNARLSCDGISIPIDALAIVGNATVVNNTAGSANGFATLYPSNTGRPTASNLNYVSGQIVPNAFTVGLSGDGAFNIYTSSTTNFIVDVTGYYAPPAPAGLFYHALPRPVRLLDTRSGQPACDAPGATLTGGQTRTQAARVSCDGLTIPASAKAIVGNATVVNDSGSPAPGQTGFVTLYPSGVARPGVSNLNYTAGQIVPNAFTVGLGTDGGFNIYATESINFVVDVTGYYSDQATDANGVGLLYFSLPTPLRLLDTRSGQSACETPGAPLSGGVERTQNARLACSGVTIPASANAIVGNATAVNTTAGATTGYVTLYPTGAARPTASNLNYVPGQIVPNMFTTRLSATGAFQIYATSETHFIIDVAGFFMP